MKRIAAVMLALLLTFSILPEKRALAARDYSEIKVKLTTNNATSIMMISYGDYFINETGASFGKGNLTLRVNADGTLTANHSSAGDVFTGKSFSLMREDMAPSSGYMRFNGRNYLGHFNIRVTSSGYIQIVNVVPLSHYLYGVVGHEMNNTFPLEALKAQAIAAKCYVLSRIEEPVSSEYDIGDTSSDQVYKGYTESNTNVIRAVDETISEILTVKGKLLCTYYAASNGGETNLVTYAWPTGTGTNAGYAIATDDYDFANTMSTLEVVKIPVGGNGNISQALYNLILSQASMALGVTPSGIDVIKSVDVNTPKLSGTTRNMGKVTMVLDVVADGTDSLGNTSSYLYEDVSITFNTSDLYTYGVVSNATLRVYWGEYAPNGGYYYIYHARWGHGVGLSQRGAQQRAAAGHSYRDILSFYYPGASFGTIEVKTPVNPVKPGSSSILGQPVAYGVVTGDSVHFRSGPAVSYESKGRLMKNSDLAIYGLEDGWYHAVAGGVEGYISAQYVKIVSEVTVPSPTPTTSPGGIVDPPAVAGYGEVTGKGVNFRSGPSTSNAILDSLALGTPLELYSLSNGWYYALANGKMGYISATYVKVVAAPTQPASPSPQPSPTPNPSAVYTSVQKGIVTGDLVNFRQGPDKSYTSLARLKKNTGLYLIEQYGSWYYAIANGAYGYIYHDYVRITGEAKVDANGNIIEDESGGGAKDYGAGVTTGNVNFRSGPGATYDKLKTLSKGVTLKLYAITSGWYKATLSDGTAGYVSSKYVSVTDALPAGADTSGGTPPQVEEAKAIGMGVTTGTVNFREGPSASARKISQLKSGVNVVLYALSDGWYEVEYNGTHGYLSAKYVKMTAQSVVTAGGDQPATTPGVTPTGAGLQLASGVSTGALNFRTKPSTNEGSVMLKMSANTGFSILGQIGEWYYILYNSKTGFVYKAYTKVTSAGNAGIPTVGGTLTMIDTFTTAEANLRDGAATSSNVIRLLQNHTDVEVYLILGEWCLVKAGSDYGYVKAEYVKLS